MSRSPEDAFAIICKVYYEESEHIVGRPRANGRAVNLKELAAELGIGLKKYQSIMARAESLHHRRKRDLLGKGFDWVSSRKTKIAEERQAA